MAVLLTHSLSILNRMRGTAIKDISCGPLWFIFLFFITKNKLSDEPYRISQGERTFFLYLTIFLSFNHRKQIIWWLIEKWEEEKERLIKDRNRNNNLWKFLYLWDNPMCFKFVSFMKNRSEVRRFIKDTNLSWLNIGCRMHGLVKTQT